MIKVDIFVANGEEERDIEECANVSTDGRCLITMKLAFFILAAAKIQLLFHEKLCSLPVFNIADVSNLDPVDDHWGTFLDEFSTLYNWHTSLSLSFTART